MSLQFVQDVPHVTKPERMIQPVCVVAFLRPTQAPVLLSLGASEPDVPGLPLGLRACVVQTWHGKLPPDSSSTTETSLPATSSRSRGSAQRPLRIDHLTFTDRTNLASLPGLLHFGSLVRESLQTLLEGLPQVELFLLQAPPDTRFSTPGVLEQLELALAEQTGALVLFPDLAPAPVVPGSLLPCAPSEVLATLSATLRAWSREVLELAPMLNRLSLITLLDLPLPTPDALAQACLHPELERSLRPRLTPRLMAEAKQSKHLGIPEYSGVSRPSARALLEEAIADTLEQTLHGLEGLQGAVLAFSGPYLGLRAHAWRSPSALAVRTLLGETDFARQAEDDPVAMTRLAAAEVLERRVIRLPTPRYVPETRIPALTPGFPLGFRLPDRLHGLLILLEILPDGQRARFEGQRSLAAPVGRWPLPALRTLKALELHIRKVAEQFVFRPVDALQALELNRVLTLGLADYIRAGALVPPLEGQSLLETEAVRGTPPSLQATLQATLRPWTLQLRVRLSIQSTALSVEVDA